MTQSEVTTKKTHNIKSEWKAILFSVLIFVSGLSFFAYTSFLLWMARHEGPNNKALMQWWFYVCSITLLVIQSIFLVIYFLQRKFLRGRFKVLSLVMVILGLMPGLFWVTKHILAVFEQEHLYYYWFK